MTRVPGGTLTGTPSMVRLIEPSAIGRRPSGRHGAFLPRDVRLELALELPDPAHDRRRARVRQHADRLPRHVVGEVEQQVEVLHGALLLDLADNMTGKTICVLSD